MSIVVLTGFVGGAAAEETCTVTVSDGESVQEAIDGVGEGGVVCLETGDYEESVTIATADVSLVAADGHDPVLNGTAIDESGVTVEADGVAVEGVEVSGYGADGVRVDGSEDVTIENVTVVENGHHGIAIASGSHGATVRDAVVGNNADSADSGPYHGVYATDADSVTIEDSTVEDHAIRYGQDDGDGLRVEGGDDLTVENATIVNSEGDGIRLSDASGPTIANGTIDDSGGGGVYAGSSVDNATVVDSEVSDSWENGLTLRADDSIVEGNEIAENGERGLFVRAAGTTVADNEIRDNGDDGLWANDAERVTIRNNTVADNGGRGMWVLDAVDTAVAENTVIRHDEEGIHLGKAVGNVTIEDNVMNGHEADISLDASNDTTVASNDLATGVVVDGEMEAHYRHDVAETNTVGLENGSIRYVIDERDVTIDEDVGQVVLVNADGASVTEQAFEDAAAGVQVAYSDDVAISNSSFVEGGWYADVTLEAVENATIVGNHHDRSNRTAIRGASISDVTIEETTVENAIESGIFLTDSSGTHVRNVTVRNVDDHGIELRDAIDPIVENATVNDVEGSGIDLRETQNATIESVAIRGAASGISTFDDRDLTVADADVGASGTGIALASGLEKSLVTGSAVWGNDVGIEFGGTSVTVGDTVVTNSTDAGIEVISDDPSKVVVDSTVQDNAEGVVYRTSDPDDNVTARDNWWGDESGPSGAGDGDGDSVDEYVDYEPFGDEPEHRIFDVTIENASDQTAEAEAMTVNATVENVADRTATRTVALESNRGEVVDETDVTLDPGEKANVTLTWETEEGDADSIYAPDLENGVVVRTEHAGDYEPASVWRDSFFEIFYEDAAIGPVYAGKNLTVEAYVTSWSTNDATQTIELVDPDGEVVDETELTLESGDVEHVNLTWETTADDVGTANLWVRSENTRDTRAVEIAEPPGALFEVAIADTNAPIDERETLAVDVDVENVGTEGADQTVELLDSEGEVVDSIDVTLDADESATVALEWNTEEGDAGDREIAVRSENDSASETVEIEALPGPIVTVAIDETNAPIDAGETLTVEATVGNEGSHAAEQTIELLDSDDEVVDATDVTLDVDESTTITLEWDTDDGDAGEAGIAVRSENDSASESATLYDPDGVSYANLSVSATEVTVGTTVTVSANVSNGGDSETEYTAPLVVDGETVDETTGTLEAGASETVSFALPIGDAGETDVTIDDLDPKTVSATMAWPQYGLGNANRGHAEALDGPTTTAEEAWTFPIDASMYSSPAIVDGVAYVGANDDRLYAIDVGSGAERWNYTAGDQVWSSPAVDDGTVYVGVTDGSVVALDADDGTELWTESIGDDVRGPVTVAEGVVYVGTNDDDGELYALDADDGSVLWSFAIGDGVQTAPAVVEGVVYVGSMADDSTLYALDASEASMTDDERELWTFQADESIRSSPVVSDGVVYVGSGFSLQGGGGIHAIDAADGSELWTHSTADPVQASPAIANETVYVGKNDGEVLALDSDDGSVAWTFETGASTVGTPPAVADETVYAGTSDGDDPRVYAIDADTGDERWVHDVGGSTFAGPAVLNGTVYVGSHDVGLIALEPADDGDGQVLDGMDGSGTEDDPYVITNATELQAMAEDLEAHYVLGEDVDATGTETWNDGAGFEQIGNDSEQFNGTFDGRGHSIEGLTIDRPDERYVGLFGFTWSSATVENVHLADVSIVGDTEVGGVAGQDWGTIRGVSVSGEVTGTGPVGGLTGDSTESIENVSADVTVVGEYQVGGVVGTTTGPVENATASGDVTGDESVGGLAGRSGSTTTISNASATGDVTGTGDHEDGDPLAEIGGLVGSNGGTITDAYAIGDVDGSVGVGGLAGTLGSNAEIDSAYAAGHVAGDADVGGLVGASDGTVTDSYWDEEATNQEGSANGTALTTAEMTGEAAESNMAGFDFGAVWTTTDAYPLLEVEGTDDDETGDEPLIVGTVTDADDGTPVEGAYVDVYDADTGDMEGSAETDANGNYEIAVSGEGTYELEVFADGYQVAVVSGVDVAGEETIVDVELEEDANLVLEASVRHVGGSEPAMESVSIQAFGDDRPIVRLRNESADPGDFESTEGYVANQFDLAGLGADETTELELEVRIEDGFDPRAVVGTGDVDEWTIEENDDGTVNVAIVVRPVAQSAIVDCEQEYVGCEPSLADWPEDDDEADVERGAVVSLQVDDLGSHEEAAAEPVNGTAIGTNAQRYSLPRHDLENRTLTVVVGGPSVAADGEANEGEYEAFLPDGLLDEWTVADPKNLDVSYDGEPIDAEIETVDGGAVVSVAHGYSTGAIEIAGPSLPDAVFTVDVVDATEPVFAGETVAVEANVTNVGGGPGEETIDLRDGDGEIVDEATVELADNESTTVTLEWPTDESDVGTQEASVVGSTDTDFATIEVLAEDALAVLDASVDRVDGGAADLESIGIETDVADGAVAVRLVNETAAADDPTAEAVDRTQLAGLIEGDTVLELELQLANADPRTLAGTTEPTGDWPDWTVEENDDGTVNVTIELVPTAGPAIVDCETYDEADGCEPTLDAWPEGTDDIATHQLSGTVDLVVGDASRDGTIAAVEEMRVLTDGRAFAAPRYDGDRETIAIDVGAPARDAETNPNEGVFVAFVPDALAAEWGVDDPDQFVGYVDGGSIDIDANDVSGGYQVALEDYQYSTGAVTIEIGHEVPDPAEFDVEILAATDEAPEGSTVTVSTEVTNVGDEAGYRAIRLYHGDDPDAPVYEYLPLELDPGESEVVELQWESEEGDLGEQALTVTSEDVENDYEVDDSDETAVEIVELGLGVSSYPSTPTLGEDVIFQTNYAEDPHWDFGDGESATGGKVIHQYDEPGEYTVTLTDLVTGETETVEIEVREPTVRLKGINAEKGGVPLAHDRVDWEETFAVNVESDNDVESVAFELDGETVEGELVDEGIGSDRYEATFELGDLEGAEELTVTATDEFGVEDERTRTVEVTEVPTWMTWMMDAGAVDVDRNGNGIFVRVTAMDVLQDFGLGSLPMDADNEFDGQPEAVALYDAEAVGADVRGEGSIDGTILDVDYGAEMEVDGTVDSQMEFEEASAYAGAEVENIPGPSVGIDAPWVGEVQANSTIDASMKGQGEFDEEFAFEKGTLQPGAGITIVATIEVDGCGVYAEGSGNVEVGWHVGEDVDADFGGAASVGAGAGVFCGAAELGFEVGPYETEFGDGTPLAASGGPIGPTNVTVEPREKYGENPGSGASTLDDSDSKTAASGEEAVDRLTDRDLEDGQPAIASVGDDVVAVWSAQDEDKNVTDGRDLRVRTYDAEADEWTDAESLTDDDTSDEAPALAATDDGAIAVWSTASETFDEGDFDESGEFLERYEIAYAIYDGEEWSDPVVVTDTDDRQFAPAAAPIDGGWAIAWQSDGAIGEDGDRDGWYAIVDEEGDHDEPTRLANATAVSIGDDGDGASLAYATDESGTVEVVTERLDGESAREVHSHEAGDVTDVATANGRTIWVEGDAAEPALVEATAEGVDGIDVDEEFDHVTELSLDARGDDRVLAYRARSAGTNSHELVYRLDRGDGWIEDRAYADPPGENLTVWFSDVAFAGDGGSFRAAYAAQPIGTDAVGDVFVAEHEFRPAYAVDADATEAAVGEESTIAYDVRNVGDTTGDAVTVVIENDAETVAEIEHDPLEAGETVSNAVDATVGESGAFEISVDGGDGETLETGRETATATAATAALSIGAIETEPGDGETIVVAAELENDGAATASEVPIVFDDGTGELATAGVDRIAPGGNATASATIDPDAVDASVLDEVRIATEGGVDEADVATEGTYAWFVQPNLEVGSVEYVATDDGVTAEVLVANRGLGPANATVTIVDDGSGETLGETDAEIDAAADGTARFESVEVDLGEVAEGTSIRVGTDTDVPDADPAITGATDEVGPILDADRPSFGVAIADGAEAIEAGDALEIGVEIENDGLTTDEQPIALVVDGETVDERAVTLEPGETTTETFAVESTDDDVPTIELEVRSDTARDYATTTVEPAEDGSESPSDPTPAPTPAPEPEPEPEPASFEVIEIEAPESIEAGDPLAVNATVRNVGEAAGTRNVTIGLDDRTIDGLEIELDGGESETIEYEITEELQPGEYAIVVETADGNETATVRLSAPADGEDDADDVDDEDDADHGEGDAEDGDGADGEDDDRGEETGDDDGEAEDDGEDRGEETAGEDADSDDEDDDRDGNGGGDGADDEDDGDGGDDTIPGFGVSIALAALAIAGLLANRRR